MAAKDTEESSSEEGELFGGMGFFAEREPEEEVVVFHRIVFLRAPPSPCNHISSSSSSNSSNSGGNNGNEGEMVLNVRFDFSFCEEHLYSSYLQLAGPFLTLDDVRGGHRTSDNTDGDGHDGGCGGNDGSTESKEKQHRRMQLNRALLSIGMAVLPWMWMGYGTRKVAVKEDVLRAAGIFQHHVDLLAQLETYWKEVYRGVLAEFFYVNNTSFSHVDIAFEAPIAGKAERFRAAMLEAELDQQVIASKTSGSKGKGAAALVPLGGGKDSLVVWHMVHEQMQKDVTLFYVCDGFQEYAQSQRLHRIVEETASPCLVIKHDFSELYENPDSSVPEGLRCQRSDLGKIKTGKMRTYLKPCGHPWAALVYFDALLVCCLSGTREVYLGHEKSADEGNGVFIADTLHAAQVYEVNHQYDKSNVFLNISQQYVDLFFNDDILITSPLRNMWELEIARIFCQEPKLRKFHNLFLSCNEPSYSYCAWLDASYVNEHVFPGHANLLQLGTDSTNHSDHTIASVAEDASPQQHQYFHGTSGIGGDSGRDLLKVFQSLLQPTKAMGKPFDCVGTASEAKAAFVLSWWRYVKQCQRAAEPVVVSDRLREVCKFSAVDCDAVDYWQALPDEAAVLALYEL